MKRYALHQYLRLDPQLVWMGPVSEACLLLIPAFLVWLYLRRQPAARWWQATVALFATAMTFGNLLLVSQLHEAARLVLAAGVGIQTGRLAAAHPRVARLIVRRSLPALLAVVLLMAAGINGARSLADRRAVAALPPPPADAPNVLLIILDTVRSLNLSLYGYPRPTTPGLQRLGARGVVFDRAIAPAPWTLPSHASIFTGRDARELSADWRAPLDTRYATLAGVLGGRGYLTAGFTANLVYTTRESGVDRGFDHYEDYALRLRSVFYAGELNRHLLGRPAVRALYGDRDLTWRKPAGKLRQRVATWLGAHTGRPYFAFVNFYDAHNPYLPPAPFDTAFGPRAPWRDRNIWMQQDSPVTVAAAIIERDAYDAALAYLDHEVDALLRDLEARGLLRNTLVVLTADHGEEFGEHGLLNHGNSLYLASLHVPLIVVWPGHVPEGRRIAPTVPVRDVAATILDLAGVGAALPGASLRRLWSPQGDSATPPAPAIAEVRRATGLPGWFPVSRGSLTTVVTDTHQYILGPERREQLFDLRADPTGSTPALEDAAAIRAQLRALAPGATPPR